MTDFDTIVEWCLASLREEPRAWTIDDYRATHKNGVSVWMANSHYGMAIEYRKFKVGGVTGWSSLLGGLIPWRRRLRAAVRALPQYPLPASKVILQALRA